MVLFVIVVVGCGGRHIDVVVVTASDVHVVAVVVVAGDVPVAVAGEGRPYDDTIWS